MNIERRVLRYLLLVVGLTVAGIPLFSIGPLVLSDIIPSSIFGILFWTLYVAGFSIVLIGAYSLLHREASLERLAGFTITVWAVFLGLAVLFDAVGNQVGYLSLYVLEGLALILAYLTAYSLVYRRGYINLKSGLESKIR